MQQHLRYLPRLVDVGGAQRRGQCAAFLIIVAGAIAAIFTVFAVAVALMQRNAVRAYATTVADAAALAATSALTLQTGCTPTTTDASCKLSQRWENALRLACYAAVTTTPTTGLLPISAASILTLAPVGGESAEDLNGLATPSATTYEVRSNSGDVVFTLKVERGY